MSFRSADDDVMPVSPVTDGPLRPRIVGLGVALLVVNLAAWLWAFAAFHQRPVLLGTALLAYSLGLRHATDADHLAAIDNVTRRLMQAGRRPVSVGFFFALGHSTIVVLASVLIAAGVDRFGDLLDTIRATTSLAGTLISTAFLLGIAAMNAVILAGMVRSFRRMRAGLASADPMALAFRGGPLSRVLRPVFGMIRRSWQMYPLGFLFGLGFDTATEIGLLGISATQAAQGMSPWTILVFPALFTAGMSLVDTADGVLMIGAYGWALAKPLRRLYYNMTITFISVMVALLVGGIEALGLAAGRFHLSGPFWDGVGALNDHFGLIGGAIIGLFVLSWAVSALLYRVRGYHRLETGAG